MKGRALAWLRRHALDLAGALAATVYALPSLAYPFEKDQAVHWYIGRGLLEGELPYVSGVSTKPPGAFVVHALSILLFGNGQHAVRVADLLFVLGGAALVATFRLRTRRPGGVADTRFRRDGEIGLAAVLLAAIHYTYFDFAATGHPELWQSFFMLGSLWVIARLPDGRPTARAALASGALAGTAVMFKHTAVTTGLLAGIAFVVLGFRARGLRRSLAMGGLYSAGVFAAMGAFLVPYALTGTLDVVYDALVERILKYASSGSAPSHVVPPWMTWRYGGLVVLFAVAGLTSGLAVAGRLGDRRERRLGWWIAAGTLLALASALVQPRAIDSPVGSYYFIVTTPFSTLCITWGLRQRFVRRMRPRLVVAAALVALGFAWGPEWPHADEWSYRKEWASWLSWVRGHRSYGAHIDHFGPVGALDRYPRQVRVARFIRARARPDDTLCVQGFVTPIYALTDLRCPSRHFAEVSAYEGLDGWLAEHRRALRASPPTFVVTFSDRERAIRELVERGYERHVVERSGRIDFVVMERRPRSEDAR
jgi:hypothetical protein